MESIPFRQVHLDFHTSEKIASVAEDFDPQEFARTLQAAGVNSVTCFSRCHHGMIYHDTRFEARHPGLRRDLLREQIDACHAVGIRVPIYITVGWDEFMAARHPEWREVEADGRLQGAGPLEAGWRKLCLNSPYVDYLAEQTLEVLERFPTDGLFFDIIKQGPCCCPLCMAGMVAAGLDPQSEAARLGHARGVLERFIHRMTATVRGVNRECGIFYNSGHVSPAIRATLHAYSHMELESLPSGGWGYDHFPITVRFARRLGKPLLGMTGRFHASWGDFGGYKNPAALQFECFTALAEGAGCSTGDQLHPSGRLDPATYDLIGGVYRSVAEKEPWCAGAEAVAEIAIFTPEAQGRATARVDAAAGGAMRMLLEGHHQCDVVDEQSDWDRYRVLILPDKVALDEALHARVREFLAAGGAVIASHRSGFAPEGDRFVFAEAGVNVEGEAEYCPDYLVAHKAIGAGIPDAHHVMYERGLRVTAAPGTEALADVWNPYFNRTWEHFCSHRQTPACAPAARHAVTQRGRVVYFAHPIFSAYMTHGPRVYRQLVLNCLARLLPEPVVTTDAPTTARISLTRQPEQGRHVLHLLHYIPERRYGSIPNVEDVIPLRDVRVTVRLPVSPSRIALAPCGKELPFSADGGAVTFAVPEVRGHQLVALAG